MASLRTASRLQVGSATWISEERTSALQIAEAEAEEFTFSARNELDWLNEHMAEIFNENQLYVRRLPTDIYTNNYDTETLQRYLKRLESYVERPHEQRGSAILRKLER